MPRRPPPPGRAGVCGERGGIRARTPRRKQSWRRPAHTCDTSGAHYARIRMLNQYCVIPTSIVESSGVRVNDPCSIAAPRRRVVGREGLAPAPPTNASQAPRGRTNTARTYALLVGDRWAGAVRAPPALGRTTPRGTAGHFVETNGAGPPLPRRGDGQHANAFRINPRSATRAPAIGFETHHGTQRDRSTSGRVRAVGFARSAAST